MIVFRYWMSLIVLIFGFIVLSTQIARSTESPSTSKKDSFKKGPIVSFGKEITLSKNIPDTEIKIEMKISTKDLGIIESGIYKGNTFVLAKVERSDDGPCYPPSACGSSDFSYLRLVKTKDSMILLTRASMGEAPWLSKKEAVDFSDINPFKQMKLAFKTDDETEIEGFSSSQILFLDKEEKKELHFRSELESFTESKFEKYFSVPGVGDVYTLKKEKSRANDTFVQAATSSSDELKLEDMNVFYLKKPDATYSIYNFEPDIYSDNRISEKLPYQYTHKAFKDCGGALQDSLDVLDLKVKEKDLKVAAKTFDGDSLYFPPEAMLKQFYNYYLDVKDGEHINTEDNSAGNRTYLQREENLKIQEPDNFNEFKKMTPMVIWKSPLGQWVRFVRVRFLKPKICG